MDEETAIAYAVVAINDMSCSNVITQETTSGLSIITVENILKFLPGEMLSLMERFTEKEIMKEAENLE